MKDILLEYYYQVKNLTNGSLSMPRFKKENTFEIDGQMLNSSDDYIKWDKIKTIIYSIIRGDKRPVYMKIILKEDEKYSCDEYISYILDITFNQSLKIKSGVSYKQFTFDKSFENNWDDEVLKLLNDDKITFKVEE